MRRWLVAVFALHFLVSVGAFAFGSHAHPAAAQAPAAQALLAEAASPASVSGQADAGLGKSANAAADHGLIDDQPDLPECLDVPIRAAAHGPIGRTPPPPLAKDLTPPVLDGLQRPPRGLPAFA